MKKIISLIKTSMNDNMSLFKINGKKQSKFSKKVLPIILAIICFAYFFSYSKMLIEPLASVNMEYVLLTIFVVITTVLTLTEGIYKVGGLLFNCKDDNLMLSLPIKKSTVLFVRIFKFYVFELLYNSLFLIPAMVVYAIYVNVGIAYFITSLIAILLLPIIPIVISCIIGVFISFTSSKFRLKNIAQIVLTTGILLVVLYLSFNIESFMNNIAENASSINEIITKIYYPAGAYINLVINFNIVELILFILIHIAIFIATIFILSKIYFRINSNVKSIRVKNNQNNKYKIKASKPVITLIKKEFNRFINSPVFVINAGFGLVLFVVGCILICVKFDTIAGVVVEKVSSITIEQIKGYIPVVLFGFISFASLMSSITSSMISLEGKSFNILKTLPIKPFKIITAKVLSAVIIMMPFILIGDLIIMLNFSFNLFEIAIILVSSIVMPIVAETIGIIVNLKYPKMDAENDTEVVKQSMSSMVAVFIGMISVGITIFALIKAVENNIAVDLIIGLGLGIYSLILIALLVYINSKGTKDFNNINI